VPVVWRERDAPQVGSWLATTGVGALPAAVGVVSVEPRRIAQTSGMLGIVPEDSDDGPIISRVFAGSGAEKAGLRVNDVVTKLNGRTLSNREALFRQLSRMKAGQTVKLTVKRGERELEIEATLTSRDNEQESLGSELSERRGGFASAFQHDTVLDADQCGGPVVDLDGKVVGINIARAGRVVSYALPAAAILPLLSELESGKRMPGAAPNPRLAELDKALDTLRTSERDLTKEVEQLRAALEQALAVVEKAKQDAAAAQEALKQAETQAASAVQAVKSVEAELAAAQTQIDKLTSEKTSLSGEGER
jgi:serine protease Do